MYHMFSQWAAGPLLKPRRNSSCCRRIMGRLLVIDIHIFHGNIRDSWGKGDICHPMNSCCTKRTRLGIVVGMVVGIQLLSPDSRAALYISEFGILLFLRGPKLYRAFLIANNYRNMDSFSVNHWNTRDQTWLPGKSPIQRRFDVENHL